MAVAICLAASAPERTFAQGLPVLTTRLPAVESQPFALPQVEEEIPTNEADQVPVDFNELGANVVEVDPQTSLERRLCLFPPRAAWLRRQDV